MARILVPEMSLEAGLELGTVIRLVDLHAEGQPPPHLVDGRELVQAPPGARDTRKELDVYLQAMIRVGVLTALPAVFVGTGLLVGRRSTKAASHEYPVHGRGGDRELVKSLQIPPDSASTDVIVLPQIKDLADHFGVIARGDRCGLAGRLHRPASPCSMKRLRHL